MRKIALEEAFITPDTVEYFKTTAANHDPQFFQDVIAWLFDFGGRRLEVMDANGIGRGPVARHPRRADRAGCGARGSAGARGERFPRP